MKSHFCTNAGWAVICRYNLTVKCICGGSAQKRLNRQPTIPPISKPTSLGLGSRPTDPNQSQNRSQAHASEG